MVRREEGASEEAKQAARQVRKEIEGSGGRGSKKERKGGTGWEGRWVWGWGISGAGGGSGMLGRVGVRGKFWGVGRACGGGGGGSGVGGVGGLGCVNETHWRYVKEMERWVRSSRKNDDKGGRQRGDKNTAASRCGRGRGRKLAARRVEGDGEGWEGGGGA